jgi:thiamine-monophosphate kinase
VKVSEAGGEYAIIELAREASRGLAGRALDLGIGDDAALVRFGDQTVIVTCDILVESVHFRTDWASPFEVGWKSAAVNISDIAAMGGVPQYAFVSIGVPDADFDFVSGFYDGLRSACERWTSTIAGGDTARSDAIVVNITWLGDLSGSPAILRSGARPGDALMVTNCLGDSLAGLNLLQAHGQEGARAISTGLVDAHLKPIPRVEAARAAAGTGAVHAMMDLSDGLAADLTKLCAASGVGARVDSENMPVSDELRSVCQNYCWKPSELACVGGEDYELLMAVDPSRVNEVRAAVRCTGSEMTVIGEILDGDQIRVVGPGGVESDLPDSWEHF